MKSFAIVLSWGEAMRERDGEGEPNTSIFRVVIMNPPYN
jgi:hypothetical protein